MNTRERFLATMAFEPVDHGLLGELGYWAETMRRWYREGLPGKNEIPAGVGDTSSVVRSASAGDPVAMGLPFVLQSIPPDPDLSGVWPSRLAVTSGS